MNYPFEVEFYQLFKRMSVFPKLAVVALAILLLAACSGADQATPGPKATPMVAPVESESVGSSDVEAAPITVATASSSVAPAESPGEKPVGVPGDAMSPASDGEKAVLELPAGASVETEPTTPAVTDTELAAILGNLSYTGILPNQAVVLTGGTGIYDDGSSGTPTVRLVDYLIPTGDLDGDGTEDAVALLINSSSGSGTFVYLSAVLDILGNPTPTEALLIGDRVRVKTLAIDGRTVVGELTTQGPGDPVCCPTLDVRNTYALEDGRLAASQSNEP